MYKNVGFVKTQDLRPYLNLPDISRFVNFKFGRFPWLANGRCICQYIVEEGNLFVLLPQKLEKTICLSTYAVAAEAEVVAFLHQDGTLIFRGTSQLQVVEAAICYI